MKKGKDLAEYLEKGGDVDDDIKCVADFIPQYKEKEYEIKSGKSLESGKKVKLD